MNASQAQHHATDNPERRTGPDRPLWAGWRWLGWTAVLAALLGIFSFYTDPHFMVDVADKIWACF
jgi:hypothetical protein